MKFLSLLVFISLLGAMGKTVAETVEALPNGLRIVLGVAGYSPSIEKPKLIKLAEGSSLDLRKAYPKDIETYRIINISPGKSQFTDVCITASHIKFNRITLVGEKISRSHTRCNPDQFAIEVRTLRNQIANPMPLELEEKDVFTSTSPSVIIMAFRNGKDYWAIRKRDWNPEDVFSEYIKLMSSIESRDWITIK